MGRDVGHILATAIQHMDFSILYALVCGKEFSQMVKTAEASLELMCKIAVTKTTQKASEYDT